MLCIQMRKDLMQIYCFMLQNVLHQVIRVDDVVSWKVEVLANVNKSLKKVEV
jgi:hypothetical protein